MVYPIVVAEILSFSKRRSSVVCKDCRSVRAKPQTLLGFLQAQTKGQIKFNSERNQGVVQEDGESQILAVAEVLA